MKIIKISVTNKKPHIKHYLQCPLMQSTFGFIENMLFNDKIRLQDVPFRLRCKNNNIYITALRISRGISQERYMEDMATLKSDNQYAKPHMRSRLEHLYESLLSLAPNEIKLNISHTKQ